MKLSFQNKITLRNIVLSNPDLEAKDIITQLTPLFDLSREQKEYIRQVKRLNT